ncbi:hypothetical protein [Pseudoxanthomonas sp.]|uniref:hypothetical protein n=1 Tax=Pseudoxanthomonas sp. TaxID=1871049 RepID=UPI002FE4046E
MPRFPCTLLLAGSAFVASAVQPALAQMPDPSVFAQAANVARLSDSDATCEQLYAEAEWLGTRIAALPQAADPMVLSRQATEDMRQAQKKMMGGQRARSFGSALLGLVPGAGMAAGALSSLGGRPNTDAMYDAMDKTMKAQQDSMATMAQHAQLHGRREHVTDLFLKRSCKVSTLDRTAVSRATSELDAGVAPGAGAAPDASVTE